MIDLGKVGVLLFWMLVGWCGVAALAVIFVHLIG